MHLAHEVLQVAVGHLDQVAHGQHLARALGDGGGGEELVVRGAAHAHLEALELGQRGRHVVAPAQALERDELDEAAVLEGLPLVGELLPPARHAHRPLDVAAQLA